MAEIDSFTISDGNANVVEIPEGIQKMINTHRKIKKNGDMKKNG